MAAKALALAEDTYFFQSSADGPRDPGKNLSLPANTEIDNWRLEIDLGLLKAAAPKDAKNGDETKVVETILVPLASDPNPNKAIWGNNTFDRVADAIASIVGKAQSGPYALILPTKP